MYLFSKILQKLIRAIVYYGIGIIHTILPDDAVCNCSFPQFMGPKKDQWISPSLLFLKPPKCICSQKWHSSCQATKVLEHFCECLILLDGCFGDQFYLGKP